MCLVVAVEARLYFVSILHITLRVTFYDHFLTEIFVEEIRVPNYADGMNPGIVKYS